MDARDNPDNRYFVVNGKGEVISGWEFREDAIDAKRNPEDWHSEEQVIKPLKVLSRKSV